MRVDVVTEQTMIYRAEFELAPRWMMLPSLRERRRPPALELRVSQMARVLDRNAVEEDTYLLNPPFGVAPRPNRSAVGE